MKVYFCRTGVRLGEWNISSAIDCIGNSCSNPPVDVPIESTLVHWNYNMSDISQPNDIALLRLAFPVAFTGDSNMHIYTLINKTQVTGGNSAADIVREEAGSEIDGDR